MGALVGLVLGVGLFLIWWSCWVDPQPSAPLERHRGGLLDRARDLLAQAGVPTVSPQALAAACVTVWLLVAFVALAVTQSPTVAAAFATMAAWGPVALVVSRARRRRAVLRELWPEVVDNLASGVRAGLSLPEAVAQLAERGPEALRPAFEAFAVDYRATGRFGEALDDLKERLADPVADRICESLRITREVGGADLGRLLRSLSAFLREDLRTRSELAARQSWTVNAARVAVAAPWLVLAMLSSRPESVKAYNSGAGAVVLMVGGAVCLLAYRVMVRIGRLPEEERVLR